MDILRHSKNIIQRKKKFKRETKGKKRIAKKYTHLQRHNIHRSF